MNRSPPSALMNYPLDSDCVDEAQWGIDRSTSATPTVSSMSGMMGSMSIMSPQANGAARKSVDKTPFIEKLVRILEDAESMGFEHILGWQPDGLSFKVHKTKEFEDMILPRYLQQTKLRSFQRQLIKHGFTRIQGGADRGSYQHPKFVRTDRNSCLEIHRVKRSRSSGQGSSETPELLFGSMSEHFQQAVEDSRPWFLRHNMKQPPRPRMASEEPESAWVSGSEHSSRSYSSRSFSSRSFSSRSYSEHSYRGEPQQGRLTRSVSFDSPSFHDVRTSMKRTMELLPTVDSPSVSERKSLNNEQSIPTGPATQACVSLDSSSMNNKVITSRLQASNLSQTEVNSLLAPSLDMPTAPTFQFPDDNNAFHQRLCATAEEVDLDDDILSTSSDMYFSDVEAVDDTIWD